MCNTINLQCLIYGTDRSDHYCSFTKVVKPFWVSSCFLNNSNRQRKRKLGQKNICKLAKIWGILRIRGSYHPKKYSVEDNCTALILSDTGLCCFSLTQTYTIFQLLQQPIYYLKEIYFFTTRAGRRHQGLHALRHQDRSASSFFSAHINQYYNL